MTPTVIAALGLVVVALCCLLGWAAGRVTEGLREDRP